MSRAERRIRRQIKDEAKGCCEVVAHGVCEFKGKLVHVTTEGPVWACPSCDDWLKEAA